MALREGRRHVDFQVAPAEYDWQVGETLGGWQTLMRTNLPSGLFQYHDSLPATSPSRFYRLVPATP